ncbi:MAG: helix-turn-helix domain-containing protein [bacterium]|nr:helix-turn-helix domain-containing protein [bacterium]
MRITYQMPLDDLPEVLTAGDVVAFLRGIFGRNAVYDLLNSQRIRNRRHGQKFLIPKAALRDFIECRDEDVGAGAPR